MKENLGRVVRARLASTQWERIMCVVVLDGIVQKSCSIQQGERSDRQKAMQRGVDNTTR